MRSVFGGAESQVGPIVKTGKVWISGPSLLRRAQSGRGPSRDPARPEPGAVMLEALDLEPGVFEQREEERAFVADAVAEHRPFAAKVALRIDRHLRNPVIDEGGEVEASGRAQQTAEFVQVDPVFVGVEVH